MFIRCKKQIAIILFLIMVFISYSFGQIDTTLYDFNRLIEYGVGSYDIDSYYANGWAPTAQAIDVWGCGTTDRNLLLKNIELRFTGEYDSAYVSGNLTIHPIKEGTGSIATLVGARLYEIKDHPLNPNPGSNDYFNVRIPFEVWDADANEQINITIYDRIQNVTNVGDFYAFNPNNRMYCYFLHKNYSETVADVDTATGTDCPYLTWNTVFWKTDWQNGDEIYIQYFNSFGNNTPPVAQFSLNKNEITLGESVLADASMSYDADGDRLEYEWIISYPVGGQGYGNYTYKTLSEHGAKANLIPTGTGNFEIKLTVHDGIDTVEVDTSKVIHVIPKQNSISTAYSFIDTSWYRMYSHHFLDDKLLVPIEIKDIIRIYDYDEEKIAFYKDLSIPNPVRIYNIKDGLMYIGSDSLNISGYYGPGSLSIYQLESDWQTTPILENYLPAGYSIIEDNSIYGVSFIDDHLLIRDQTTLYNVDFETDPASPVVLKQHEYEYGLSGQLVCVGQYLYVGLSYPERKIEILDKNTLEYVSDLPISNDWRNFSSSDTLMFLGFKDSLQIYSISNELQPKKLSTIILPHPFDWWDDLYYSSFSGYGIHFKNTHLAIKQGIGVLFYDIMNPTNPEFKGSWYNGRYVTFSYHNNDYFIMGTDIMGAYTNDEYFGINKVNLNFLTSIPKTDYKFLSKKFALYQNYPNPFNPETTISFDLPSSNFVEIIIYNNLGQKVETIMKEYRQAGFNKISFKTKNIATGVYYYMIKAGHFNEIKKMVLLK